MAREPREQLLVDLLSDSGAGMQAANTFGLKPSIIYASQDEPNTPHITVEQPDEGPINGGQTRYSAMDAGGGTPHQTIAGTVTLHAYAGDIEIRDSAASTNSAAMYLTGTAEDDGTVKGGIIEEIARVVRANAIRPTNPTTGNQPIRVMSSGEFSPGPTDEPDQYHYVGPIDYIYRKS